MNTNKWTDTDLESFRKQILDKKLKISEEIEVAYRAGKFSTTKQIAAIVYFLTSRDSDSITGTSIVSDGGWTAGK